MKTKEQKALSFEQIAKLFAKTVDDADIFRQLDFKRMKNDSLSVKYKNQNKRICRIDTAYEKIRFTTDRTYMFNNIEHVELHTKRNNCHVYATVLVDKSEFEFTLAKIAENARLFAEDEEE